MALYEHSHQRTETLSGTSELELVSLKQTVELREIVEDKLLAVLDQIAAGKQRKFALVLWR